MGTPAGADLGDHAAERTAEAKRNAGAEVETRRDDAAEVGPRWGCLSQERSSRFVVSWNAAASEDEAAPAVVQQTRERTAARKGVQWISDGRPVYEREIRRVYRDPLYTGRPGRPRLVPTPGVGLVQAIKHRRGGRVVEVEVRTVLGQEPAVPYTICVERCNGVLRDRLACLTRKTHAFAKRSRTWDAVVTLCLFEHNWLRPHPKLRQKLPEPVEGRRYTRRSPAMAIGLTDHLWSWEEFLYFPVYQYDRE